MDMNVIDYGFIAVIALSVLISLFRGFAREALSLASLIIALWVAVNYADELIPYVSPYIENSNFRFGAAAALAFFGVLLINSLIIVIISQFIKKTGLSGFDRLLGLFFGAARGVLLVSVAVFLVGSTPFAQASWWQASTLRPEFEPLAQWLAEWVPSAITSHLGTIEGKRE